MPNWIERKLSDLEPFGSIGFVEKLLGGKMVHLIDVKEVNKSSPKRVLGRIRGAMKRGGRRRRRVEAGGWVI